MTPICKREAFVPPSRQPRGRRDGKEKDRSPLASSPVWGDAASTEGRLPMSPAARRHTPRDILPPRPERFPGVFRRCGRCCTPWWWAVQKNCGAAEWSRREGSCRQRAAVRRSWGRTAGRRVGRWFLSPGEGADRSPLGGPGGTEHAFGPAESPIRKGEAV